MNATKLLTLVASSVAMTVACAEEAARNCYYGTLTSSSRSNFTMLKEDGTPVSESTVQRDKWCDLVITNMYGENIAPSGTYSLNSLTLDYKNVGKSMLGGWSDGGQVFILGAGGLVAKPNCDYRFVRNNHFVAMQLNESQTWSGADSGTTYGAIGLGCGVYDYPNRGRVRIQANADLTWTLTGCIYVSFADTNLLTTADVVVKDKARLYFIGNAGGTSPSSGALNAKSLTLTGDGTGAEMLIIGANNGYLHSYGRDMAAPKEFDDVTLAPVVTLQNGASVKGGTVEYALTRLNVTGGDSTFSGDVTVTKPVQIDIGEGATLTFTGSLNLSDAGAISIAGEGGFCLAAGVCSVPLAGTGTIFCDPGATGETVLTGDLSNFTGTIRAKSGTVLVSKSCNLSPSATLAADEGAECRLMTEADFGEYTRNGCTYWRGEDCVSHQYLFCNAFSGNKQLSGVRFRTNAVEETGTDVWRDGCVFVYDKGFSGLTFGDNYLYGLYYKGPTSIGYLESTKFTLGAFGVRATSTPVASFYMANRKVHLAESQTWRGPDTTTLCDNLFCVRIGGSDSYYYNGSIVADQPDLEWTLAGNMLVYMYYPTNDLSATDVKIVAPARLSLQKHAQLPDYGRLKARKLTLDGGTGIVFGGDSTQPKGYYSIGSVQELSPDRVAQTIVLTNGAALKATKVTTWTGTALAVAPQTTGSVQGPFELQDAETSIALAAGSELDVTEGTFTAATGIDAVLNVTGAGTIAADVDQQGLLQLSGSTLKIAGKGTWLASLAGVAGLEIAADGFVLIPAGVLQAYAGGDIVVSSGTLVIDNDAALPAGLRVETSGTGGLVVVDPAGFDVDARMGGTKNLVDSGLVVTEKAREDETVEVADGEELAVFGSGLKASSVVLPAAGAKITFYKTAEIAAPITQQGASGTTEIRFADTNLVGTLSGYYRASAETAFCAADSRLVFAAGGTFTNAIYHYSGTVELTGGEYHMGVRNNSNYYMYGGRLVVKDGGFYRNQQDKDGNQCSLRADMDGQTDDIVIEVGEGGKMEMGNSCLLYLGKNPSYESKFVLNGGEFWNWAGDSTPRLCESGTGRATMEINAGLYRYRSAPVGKNGTTSQTSVSKFIWRGGTIGAATATYNGTALFWGNGSLDFLIDGTNCVFDASSVKSVITNFNTAVASTFRATAGSRLKVIGGTTGTRRKLCLRDCGDLNGLAFDLNSTPAVDVEIVGTGDAVDVGCVLPGAGKVRCTGTTSPLVATCVVPAGTTFSNDMFGAAAWSEGFASVTSESLAFDEGSVYQLTPVNQVLAPLAITGSLKLPATMTYVTSSRLPGGKNQPVIQSAGGVSGECVWTPGTGKGLKRTSLKVSGNDLLLDKILSGALIRLF